MTFENTTQNKGPLAECIISVRWQKYPRATVQLRMALVNQMKRLQRDFGLGAKVTEHTMKLALGNPAVQQEIRHVFEVLADELAQTKETQA